MWDEREPKAVCLDFWIVGDSKKTLQELNEFLSAFVQPYVFKMKKQGVMTEGEQDSTIVTEATKADPEPPVATTP